ncbi:hypothetical protein R3P38DRAFT_3199465 [Favolaschia claudopus]|uniref:Uncharacterized protein n=1 Tax=Favolaschia claudopus TaxID=2862362 RepID=A0AAW0B182_9AGAR
MPFGLDDTEAQALLRILPHILRQQSTNPAAPLLDSSLTPEDLSSLALVSDRLLAGNWGICKFGFFCWHQIKPRSDVAGPSEEPAPRTPPRVPTTPRAHLRSTDRRLTPLENRVLIPRISLFQDKENADSANANANAFANGLAVREPRTPTVFASPRPRLLSSPVFVASPSTSTRVIPIASPFTSTPVIRLPGGTSLLSSIMYSPFTPTPAPISQHLQQTSATLAFPNFSSPVHSSQSPLPSSPSRTPPPRLLSPLQLDSEPMSPSSTLVSSSPVKPTQTDAVSAPGKRTGTEAGFPDGGRRSNRLRGGAGDDEDDEDDEDEDEDYEPGAGGKKKCKRNGTTTRASKSSHREKVASTAVGMSRQLQRQAPAEPTRKGKGRKGGGRKRTRQEWEVVGAPEVDR